MFVSNIINIVFSFEEILTWHYSSFNAVVKVGQVGQQYSDIEEPKPKMPVVQPRHYYWFWKKASSFSLRKINQRL